MVWLYSFCKSARFLFVVLFSLNVFAAQVAIDPHPIEFKKDKIVLSGKTIQVEMAQTDDERSHGLMFRQKMSDEDKSQDSNQKTFPLEYVKEFPVDCKLIASIIKSNDLSLRTVYFIF